MSKSATPCVGLVVQFSAVVLLLTSCQTAYYHTMETLGYHKRDILANRVQKARDVQQDAKEQFQTALEKFSAVLHFRGGALEEKYNQLKAELARSESHATAVRKRIAAVEDVSEALFNEWEAELPQYTSDSLRRASARQLDQTRQRYVVLIHAMKRAEARLDPVLSALRDQVLFLKHNLNSRAIASLQDELGAVEADIASLVKELEASIAEANTFIKAMAKEQEG
jgi:enamine deaminase RidA (YjgF/YER057c/UK114 family)